VGIEIQEYPEASPDRDHKTQLKAGAKSGNNLTNQNCLAFFHSSFRVLLMKSSSSFLYLTYIQIILLNS
jgi:hypothetical protein